MNISTIRAMVGLIAAVLTTTVWGFDVVQAKTEAEIAPRSPITPVIQLSFKAELVKQRLHQCCP